MSVSSINNQSANQYITLFSNPLFLNAVKSAAKAKETDGAGSEKDDDLFANLEKLSSLLEKENAGSSSSASSASGSNPLSALLASLSASAAGTSSSKAADETAARDAARKAELDAMDQAVNDLIQRADLMEAMMDLDVDLPDDELLNLFGKFRNIIAKLDEDIRKLQKEVKDKETKSEIKLKPDSNTKSGFAEGLSLVAQ